MAVYLIYRNPYESPLGRRIVKFRDKTLLQWFQRNWITIDDLTEQEKADFESGSLFLSDRTTKIFGGPIESFEQIWTAMVKRGNPVETAAQLKKWLANELGYLKIHVGPGGHALQAAVKGSEFLKIVMMFDEQHCQSHPERTSFLIHNKQKLPTKISSSLTESKQPRRSKPTKRFVWRHKLNSIGRKGSQPGSVYAVVMTIEDSCFLLPPDGVYRFSGVRLPGLVNYLCQPLPKADLSWRKELYMLRWFAISNGPNASLKKVITDMLANHPIAYAHHYGGLMIGSADECRENFKQVTAGIAEQEKRSSANQKHNDGKYKYIPHEDFVQHSKHMVQIGFRAESIKLSRGPSQWDNQNEAIYLFDDIWAASYPELAKSLLYSGCQGMSCFKIRGRGWQ